jgi:hypothetical protein
LWHYTHFLNNYDIEMKKILDKDTGLRQRNVVFCGWKHESGSEFERLNYSYLGTGAREPESGTRNF